MYITPELEFGKLVGGQYEALHSDPLAPLEHEVIRKIPRGTTPEYELKCELRGVPVLGYIDSYDESTMQVHELKTGSSKYAWSQSRVDKHPQLKMYAACIKQMHGSYNPYIYLHWIETERYQDSEVIDGIDVGARRIRLTGKLTTFKTTVHHNDIIEYEKLVEQVARDISADYTVWSRLNADKIKEREESLVIDGVDFG